MKSYVIVWSEDRRPPCSLLDAGTTHSLFTVALPIKTAARDQRQDEHGSTNQLGLLPTAK
jgi:hypothetical protein